LHAARDKIHEERRPGSGVRDVPLTSMLQNVMDHIYTHKHAQEPEDLFETISQALLNAVDRDALSGWGAVVHLM